MASSAMKVFASIGSNHFTKPETSLKTCVYRKYRVSLAGKRRPGVKQKLPSEISGWDFMASSLAERFLFHMQFHSKGGRRHDMVGNRKTVRDQGRL